MQEDKEPLFDSVETVLATLEVTAEFAYNVKFNKERIQASLPAGHLDATTLADYLVYKVRGTDDFILFILYYFIFIRGEKRRDFEKWREGLRV